MGNVIILGSNSDIAQELALRFDKDDYQVWNWSREKELPIIPWDIVICAIGVLNPIGKFFDSDRDEWEQNVDSNALLPLRLLRRIWAMRRPDSTVIFFSGAGTSNSAATYSAYSASKFLLFKITEILDDEYEDCKFVIIGPGMLRTKIQNQTLAAGKKAANYERVWKFMTEQDEFHGQGTSHQKIYDCVRWIMKQPKEIVGGRNFYVPLDKWGEALESHLRNNKNIFKLRRYGDGFKFS